MILNIDLVSRLDLPTLLQDIFNVADKWGNDGQSGRIDPFTEVYDVSLFTACFSNRCRVSPFQLVFVMIARMTTCHDLTTHEADLKKIRELFMTLQTSSTPGSLLFPWFPSSARKTVKQVTTDIYTTLYTYVELRRNADPTNDAIDVLIADGETTQIVVEVSPTPEVA